MLQVYRLLKLYWPVCLLLGIGLFVSLQNFTPGTFLSGWDTLHPEFNFSENFSREFFGVFRPEQGLGAVAGHSFMADLPHTIIVWFLHFFLPLSTLRYVFIFSCFLIGPLGMYVFLRQLLPNKTVCFLGSLFYMFNIGTVQNFYVPFEMFVVQFAILPWIFFFATDFVLANKRTSLIGFSAAAILSSPMAFAATLWWVIFFTIGIYVSTLGFLSRNTGMSGATGANEQSKAALAGRKRPTQPLKKAQSRYFGKKVLLLLSLMLLFNLYWILPNLYFIIFHGQDVTKAATNQLFSPEAFLYNKEFGNLFSLATLHTFYFDWSMYGNGRFVKLMQPWTSHLASPFFVGSALLFAGLMLLGMLESIRQKKKILLSFLPVLGICFVFLCNDNLPLHLFSLLQKMPLFTEAFRFPDDKILGTYVFVYSLFLSFGIFTLSTFLKQHTLRLLSPLFTLFFSLLILLYALPVFQGQLISPSMRIAIPQEYFKLFAMLNRLPYGRIATLPINSPWGWEYYNWSFINQPTNAVGFQGSGFLYYGLKDPVMDRDFDRWNPQNESYYNELSYAVYTQSQTRVDAVLHKFAISYVLLDTSLIAPNYRQSTLFYPQLLTLLAKDPHIRKVATLNGHLFVYHTTFPTPQLSQTQQLPVLPGTATAFTDDSYLTFGNYQNLSPANDITDNLSRLLPLPLLSLAQATTQQNLLPFLLHSPLKNTCAASHSSKQANQTGILYTAIAGQYCDHVSITTPLPNMPLVLHAVSQNMQGLPLHLCVSDPAIGRCIIQSKLPEGDSPVATDILIPPTPHVFFSVDIDAIGIPPTTSQNILSALSVDILPQAVPPTPVRFTTKSKPIPSLTTLQNGSLYAFTLPALANGETLVLSQSYEPGWQLFVLPTLPHTAADILLLFTHPIGQHILVNSWENGWVIDRETQASNTLMVIIFLPQYLEYFGFFMGGVTSAIIFLPAVFKRVRQKIAFH